MALTKVNTDLLADGGKLNGIEAGADVTDTTNVTAAGALMDSELTSIASVKALDQGVATTDSPDFAALNVNGTATMDGLTVDGSATFTTADNSAQITLISTDTDALVGPQLNLWRNSGTGTNGDLIGQITFTGEDTVGSTNTFATISAVAEQTNNGAEDGALHFKTLLNGTLANRLSIGTVNSGGDISFYEDTGTTAKFFWDASAESLGIGTSSFNATYAPSLQVTSAANDGTGGVLIQNYLPTLTLEDISGGAAASQIQQDQTNMLFKNNGAEAMRIDSSGNVGIGCTPDTALNAFGYTVLEVAGATTAKSGAILLSNSSGTDFGQIYADNTDGWKFVNGQTTKSTIFYGGSGASEQMRIDSSGRTLFGNTDSLSGKPAGVICPMGYVGRAGTSGSSSNVFNINWTGSAAQLYIDTSNIGTISTSSDYRIKKNINPMESGAISRVLNLKPITYELTDYKELFKSDGVVREGFIAHEVQEVIPSGADGTKDEEDCIQSLRVDAIVAVLTKAIQEQQTLIESLTDRIAALEE